MEAKEMIRLVTLSLGLFASIVWGAFVGGDTSGCGKPHASNETEAWSLMSSGTNRTYLVHVPEDYSAQKQYPAIVGFHGRGGTGLYFELDTHLSQAEFTGETIMVYPDGIDKSWAGASYSKVSVQEDLQFVWDLLAKVRQDYCLDSAKIYATGHSNGGGLVNLLACNATVGAEFAAFAPVSGAFYENQSDGSDCKPARKSMPLLEIHGADDQVIPYDGGDGRGGQLPSIPDWLGAWAQRNYCTGQQTAKIFDGQVEHLTWQCQGMNGTLQHYKVNKGQHAWASEDPNLSQDEFHDPRVPINASTVVPQFLGMFERPPATEDLNETSQADTEDSGHRSVSGWAGIVIGLCITTAIIA